MIALGSKASLDALMVASALVIERNLKCSAYEAQQVLRSIEENGRLAPAMVAGESDRGVAETRIQWRLRFAATE